MVAAAKKWMWVTFLLTLFLGVGIGVLLDRFVLMPAVVSSTLDVEDRRESHRDRGRRFLAHLRQELDLTAEQERELEKVLENNHETAHEFWQRSRSEFEELRQRFRRDIREVLTESQRERFDAMLSEYDAKRKRKRMGS